jgi:serine/threonine-protein kinase HipA
MTLRPRTKTLVVHLPGRQVGTVTQSRDGMTRWAPDSAWDADGQHPRLGIDFLRRPGPRRQATGILPWFENLLPEIDSALRRRLCSAFGLRAGQSFALLGALGHDLAGAVEVMSDPAADGDPRQSEVDDADSPDASLRVAVGRMSALAGMQLKFSMSMVQERMAIPARGSIGQWIVKLPGVEYPELPAVEAATMTWAQRAGFEVPAHFVVALDRLDGIPPDWVDDTVSHAFAVRRFDRGEDGGRLHQEDLCQALALAPTNKYGNQEPRVSFDGALRFVTDVCGEATGREFARRIGFVIGSGNGDAHLKNWSLLWGNRTRPTLTPCYDLVSTIAWPRRLGWELRDGPTLALALGGEERFALLDQQALAAHARQAASPWAVEELTAGVLRAKAAWPTVAVAAPACMRTAIETHWRNVPILRRIGL